MLTDSKVLAVKPPAKGQQEHPDAKVTGLRLRVGAGGTKTWIFRARTGERTINKKLGSYPGMDLTEARTAALKLVAAIARDGSAEAVERTFGAVAEHWIKKVAKPKNDSWRLQERRLEMHVLPAWRDRKIVDIRRADVRELLDRLEGAVLPNRVLTLVKTIFRFALSRDWIDVSPAEGIRKPQVEQERDRVLTMTDMAQIWKAAELLGYPFGPYIRLLALTAQRRTEVAGMRWNDLDLDAATWTIPAADTKGDRRHYVPLSAVAVEILRALPRLGVHVFTTDGRSHMTNYAKLKARLDAFVAATGGAVEAWRLHDLRRSAATHMVRLGVREEVVGRVLNHAARGVTARVYALHTYGPEKRQAFEAWAEEIERATIACSAEAPAALIAAE
ncbi:MAG: tyrosine-type recombinase/integrase [Allosphingosinicella sp.]|uniref:tyrosine-type recombinase/integrase n=1 Tax=Allosphingosinicella sp. TaxID=2823234 RepID=UPI003945283C